MFDGDSDVGIFLETCELLMMIIDERATFLNCGKLHQLGKYMDSAYYLATHLVFSNTTLKC